MWVKVAKHKAEQFGFEPRHSSTQLSIARLPLACLQTSSSTEGILGALPDLPQSVCSELVAGLCWV